MTHYSHTPVTKLASGLAHRFAGWTAGQIEADGLEGTLYRDLGQGLTSVNVFGE
ncbi:MAG: hypothetical protein LBJ61_05560 [Deltaproteobacteria bacterium]|jgi:hypothetical protein|nr:hypothetical protein [Deltaproteobacteria bacterium]